MKIAIYGNRRQEQYLPRIMELLAAFERSGAHLVMHEKLHRYLSETVGKLSGIESVPDYVIPKADLVLSIGGDGTFLNTARWVAGTQTPILGINTGHLGYLAACGIQKAIGSVNSIVCGNLAVDERSMLAVKADGADIRKPFALNEVAILKKDTSSMLEIVTEINGSELSLYKADGLIVATPTGSTGYNLSVGGPILQPSTPAIVIAPIAPHSLTMRPVVIDDRSEISAATFTRGDSFLLSLDGHTSVLPVGSKVTVSKAPFVTRVARLNAEHDFVHTLRSKLHWGA